MSLPLAVMLGLAFGMMAWWRSFHAVIQYRLARAEGGRGGQAAARVVLSSGPWVVLGVAVLAPYVLTQPHGPYWGPFFAAFACAALPAWGVAALGARREQAAARRERRRGRLSERGRE
jgi:hypothetical protein